MILARHKHSLRRDKEHQKFALDLFLTLEFYWIFGDYSKLIAVLRHLSCITVRYAVSLITRASSVDGSVE